jgi:hydrogenase maturation protease
MAQWGRSSEDTNSWAAGKGSDLSMHPGALPFIRPLPPRSCSPDQHDRVAVVGIGNILFSDDGAGVHAASELYLGYSFSPEIDIIDGGTLGLDLLPILQDRDRVLLIDAVDFGKRPGYTALLEGDEIRCVLNPKLSVHHVGLSDLLLTAKLTRDKQLDICLAGIQPGSLALGLEMSASVRSRFADLINRVRQRLERWDVRSSGSDPDRARKFADYPQPNVN